MVLAQLPPWWKLRSRIAAARAPLRDQASHIRSRHAAGRVWWHPDIHSLSSTSSPFVLLFLFLFSMFSFDLLSSHGSGSAQILVVTASEINCQNHRICICNRKLIRQTILLSVMISVSMVICGIHTSTVCSAVRCCTCACGTTLAPQRSARRRAPMCAPVKKSRPPSPHPPRCERTRTRWAS